MFLQLLQELLRFASLRRRNGETTIRWLVFPAFTSFRPHRRDDDANDTPRRLDVTSSSSSSSRSRERRDGRLPRREVRPSRAREIFPSLRLSVSRALARASSTTSATRRARVRVRTRARPSHPASHHPSRAATRERHQSIIQNVFVCGRLVIHPTRVASHRIASRRTSPASGP